jgi:pyrroloquinoline-quinone synthase
VLRANTELFSTGLLKCLHQSRVLIHHHPRENPVMELFARLDAVMREYDVLEHPFYQRWSAGELSAQELGFYAGEYRHAVVALAAASSKAAAAAAAEAPDHEAGLREHAREEHAHIKLWQEFERVTGVLAAGEASQRDEASHGDEVQPEHESGPQQEREPLAQTSACAQAWEQGEGLLEQLAVLYAIEASQPAISQTKLDGLMAHYGYTPESPATEYFELHAVRDVEHARHARELIEQLLERAGAQHDAELQERMVDRARAALQGNWALLDGVQERFAS